MGAVGQAPVGEVSLPAFVGLVGGEPDVGRLGPFVWCWFDEAGCAQVAADRGGGYVDFVVVL